MRTCVLLVLTVAVLSSAGCGLLSRERLARLEVAALLEDGRPDPARLEALRGREPLVPGLFALSARLAAPTAPGEALALVRRGLAHHPDDPSLQRLRIELLAAEGPLAQEAVVAASLASLPPGPLAHELGYAHARLALVRGEREVAEERILALGGRFAVPDDAVADLWARLALAHAAEGEEDAADRCLDLSLARGIDPARAEGGDAVVSALLALDEAVAADPSRLRAAIALRQRAADRHPRHADLALARVADAMLAASWDEAEARLDALPEPWPERLVPRREALSAAILVRSGHLEQGLAALAARLDEHPADLPALDVLVDTWRTTGRPDDAVLIRRLEAARAALAGLQRARVDALLAEVRRRAGGDAPGP